MTASGAGRAAGPRHHQGELAARLGEMGVAVDDLDAVEQRVGAVDEAGVVDLPLEPAGGVAFLQPIELRIVRPCLVSKERVRTFRHDPSP